MKELNQVWLTQTNGKTVLSIHTTSRKFLIVFTDGTFCYYENGYEYEEFYHADRKITMQGFNDHLKLTVSNEVMLSGTLKLFLESKLFTLEEYMEFAKPQIDALIAHRKSRDIKQLADLVKKYGHELIITY